MHLKQLLRLGVVLVASLSSMAHADFETSTGQDVARSFTEVRGRAFESLATLVPGTRSEREGFSIHGASPLENGYLVDGLSLQDPVSGANASPLSVEFLRDFEVLTSGYLPQYGRSTGGLLRARTRDGSNAFHGALFGYWAPGFLEGLRTPVSSRNSSISQESGLENLGDFGATLGGPLVKDRLWFFVGVAPVLTRHQMTRTLNFDSTPTDNTSRTYSSEQHNLQAMGKLTYLLDQDHKVSLSVITLPTRTVTVGPEPRPGMPDSETELVSERNAMTTGLHYTGAFLDKRLWVDAHLGWFHRTSSSAFIGGGPGSLPPSDGADRYQGTAQATWLLEFAGTHVLRAGVDGELLSHEQNAARSGGVVIRESLPVRQELSSTRRYTSNLLGGFVQDSWTLFERLTVNAGIRYDSQWLYRPDGALAFALDHQLSPRVGLVVEPLANGRMKLFAHYAKYRGLMPLGLMWRAFPAEGRSSPNPIRTFTEPVDPALLPPSSSELVAGAEYALPWNTRLSVQYTHRLLDSALEDMSRDGGQSYFLGNPGLGLASDFPRAERTQDAVWVMLSRTFGEGWLAQASYTWSRLEGNYLGPFGGRFSGRGTGSPDFDLSSQMVNRSGPLPYDRTHTVKLFGARDFQLTRELSASLGLSYLGFSGTPINYLGSHPELGGGQTFVLPRGSSGERTPWVHVIDSNLGLHYRPGGDKVVSLTLDVFNLFNFQQVLRVDENYTYRSVLPVTTGGPGDLPGAARDVATGRPLEEGELNPGFKQPLQYQAPRMVRLGLRYAF